MLLLLVVLCFAQRLCGWTTTDVDVFGYSPNNIISFLSTTSNIYKRVRRDVAEDTPPSAEVLAHCANFTDMPHPTVAFPLVIFDDVNFNLCGTSAGKYVRMRANNMIEFAHNIATVPRAKVLTRKSMILFPGVEVKFRACCPSGNDFIARAQSTWDSNVTDINATVMNDEVLRGRQGVWYEKWLYWEMWFHLSVSAPVNTTTHCDINCKFDLCGTNGKCQCLDGYSGEDCSISPSSATHPTEEYPLYLFPRDDFKGTPLKLWAGVSRKFAKNEEGRPNPRVMEFNSFRVYFNHTVVFQRLVSDRSMNETQLFKFSDTDTDGDAPWSPASDVANIAEFFRSNSQLGESIWYNYEMDIQLLFLIKVL